MTFLPAKGSGLHCHLQVSVTKIRKENRAKIGRSEIPDKD
jgi:hypothetical protein